VSRQHGHDRGHARREAVVSRGAVYLASGGVDFLGTGRTGGVGRAILEIRIT
jgi:hypothetical protein